MKNKSLWALLLLISLFVSRVGANEKNNFVLCSKEKATLLVDNSEEKVVHLAIGLLQHDVKSVLATELEVLNDKKATFARVVVATIDSPLLQEYSDDLSSIAGKKEAFMLKVLNNGVLLVVGSDKRGTAYGVLELSRLLGVSPWEWWADSTPIKRQSFSLPIGYVNIQSPTVPYRGIFLNDEDWGLLPWSNQTYEPNPNRNHIGPQTYSRIFELMLRLRANTIWPAMHECTLPFFLTEGNRQVAADFGIYIGSSHCEPMVCNAAGEWSRRGKGDYDYVNNPKEVLDFWERRVKEVAGQDNIYTLGMRGVHDGKMQGAKTLEEQKTVLTKVLKDQRALLTKYVSDKIEAVPQVFIPYKEVLDIYNAGLDVPEEVTLMWCDDNYGYIRHFPTEEECKREGGNGIYYHISYWGRPHDYLWLNTLQPALAFQQMNEAYERGIRKMWIINVGDIKPGEYLLELLMDMAWDIEAVKLQGVKEHNRRFWIREFGKEMGDSLFEMMQTYYRLNYIHRPEFMGNTRTEERAPEWKRVKDLPWSEAYIARRMEVWSELSDKAEKLSREIPLLKQDEYFQLVKYPVQASAQMNKKLLSAQLARHGQCDWGQSDAAYDSIAALTAIYNNGIRNHGKWRHIMDFRPRRLPVFDRVRRDTLNEPLPKESLPLEKWNAMDCSSGYPMPCEALGYEEGAAVIPCGASISFESTQLKGDSVDVIVTFVPRHPIDDGGKLRVAVSLDGGHQQILSFQTKGRSEEWKENILWNRAVRCVRLPLNTVKPNNLTITALDEGVILDQVIITTPLSHISPYQ